MDSINAVMINKKKDSDESSLSFKTSDIPSKDKNFQRLRTLMLLFFWSYHQITKNQNHSVDDKAQISAGLKD